MFNDQVTHFIIFLLRGNNRNESQLKFGARLARTRSVFKVCPSSVTYRYTERAGRQQHGQAF